MRSPLFNISSSFVTIGALTLLATACTFFSGVEELELRSDSAGTSPSSSSSSGDAAADSPFFDPTSLLYGDSGTSGTTNKAPIGKPAEPGSLVCGATGTWSKCEIADTLSTCAMRCQARGLSCVESCCAYDNLGDYVAKVGMVYTTTSLNACDLSSVPSTSSAGLCSDPILPLGAMDVRCCCR